MKLTERILIALFVLACVLRIFHLPGGGLLTVLSLFVLSVFYIVGGYWLLAYGTKKESTYENNTALSILAGIALCFAIIGVLFRLMIWPGDFVELIAGCVFTGAVLIAGAILFKGKPNYYRQLFIRVGAVFFISLILLFVSGMDVYRFVHRDDPALIEKFGKVKENPDDSAAAEDYYNYLDKKNP